MDLTIMLFNCQLHQVNLIYYFYDYFVVFDWFQSLMEKIFARLHLIHVLLGVIGVGETSVVGIVNVDGLLKRLM